ncbi:MAG: LysR substrate-binding domain-containing protein [Aliidongia sp.]
MSVTMVSNHVQSLEDRLGARLLNRTTRKVGLTEIGKAYYERCVQILGELEDADRIAEALHSTPRGTLRLYCGSHIVRFIAPVVSEYLGLYPDASIAMTTGERLVDLVEEGFDLAIWTMTPPDSSLIVRTLSPWRHVLCCRRPIWTVTGAARRPPIWPGTIACATPITVRRRLAADRAGGEQISVKIGGNLVTTSGETLRRARSTARACSWRPASSSPRIWPPADSSACWKTMRRSNWRSARSIRTGTICRARCAASSTC